MAKKLFHGDPAPDFTLATPHGVELSLHASLRKGPAVLEFIRGTWDPAARERITELAWAKERIEDLCGMDIEPSLPCWYGMLLEAPPL